MSVFRPGKMTPLLVISSPPSLVDEVVDHWHDVELKSESFYRNTFDTMYDLPGKQVYAVFEAL
ncbi:MAG: hypothetical protein QOK76_06780, partial [Nitrososphaeraceae archaeon]|nr:hypothetical protein [Nitrososphaeraceae archaeon]